ncbi:MAG: Gfo/Idh/MocA family oxidoreductase [Armatimonadetes bacterium]|nr:Gfo/Idh/MocA family oxidoreductase [Armatimonadota bacterium]MDE2206163.1 Gfo/Idh/MocA family oxidoreductase [Armatimonadota bacterium]
MTADKLRWAILGTGRIANKFADGVARSLTGEVTVVGSRTAASAQEFASPRAIEHAYGTYQEAVDSPYAEAVYISLPNHLHAEWSVAAARAGKHVLCEKPLAMNAQEAETVIGEARRADVFFMEAFMYRCHPQIHKLWQLMQEGAIGTPRMIQATFSFHMRDRQDDVRRQAAIGGGGIMDVGCYTMSLARLAAGAEPESIAGHAEFGPTGVDEWATASVKFAGGCLANLACGMSVGADSEFRVWGSDGWIRIPHPWLPGEQGETLTVMRLGASAPETLAVDSNTHLFALEADAVATHLKDRQAPRPWMSWQDSLGQARALDWWRHSAGVLWPGEAPHR